MQNAKLNDSCLTWRKVNSQLGVVLCLPVLVLILSMYSKSKLQAQSGEKTNPEKPSNNSQCLVCHGDLKTEILATVHLDKGITCAKCHGPSVHHMQDEMLMTKPDILFGRAQVDNMCRDCHAEHKNPEAVEQFRQKWLGRTRPNGRTITAQSICTDCHGTHNIVKQPLTPSVEQPAQWQAIFNGRNFNNWQVCGPKVTRPADRVRGQPTNSARWTVKKGQIVATPGPNGEGGNLWTEQTYQDYLLSVTFRAVWPIHAGIWLRASKSNQGPRVEIFESPLQLSSETTYGNAYAGSVWMAGRLILVNLRKDLVDYEGWNTISVKLKGNQLKVWLNGEEIGSVYIIGPTKGKIGLHLASNPAYKNAKLYVREVLIQRLDESIEKGLTTTQRKE